MSAKKFEDAIQRIDATDGVERNRAIRLLADADSDAVRISDDVLTVNAERHGMDANVKYLEDNEESVIPIYFPTAQVVAG